MVLSLSCQRFTFSENETNTWKSEDQKDSCVVVVFIHHHIDISTVKVATIHQKETNCTHLTKVMHVKQLRSDGAILSTMTRQANDNFTNNALCYQGTDRHGGLVVKASAS